MTEHYNQTPKRKAKYIKPPNSLKQKVGSGGISDQILNKAQKLLENNTVDFQPLAEIYLNSIMKGIELSRNHIDEYDTEELIAQMLYPSVQLKANGGMFHYHLITKMSDKLVQFLEVIEIPDIESLEIVLAFHTTIKAVLLGKIVGDGGSHGADLINALDDACMRYFSKNPDNIDRKALI